MLISLMIEGAFGLDWPRWQRLVRAAEDMGFDGLYRSDHFMDGTDSHRDALEAYISLAWAADHTERIELGTLVSPVSFRDPRILAWQAAAVNDLAKGRLRLGLGTGWQTIEHEAFGFDLGSMDQRFARLEEGLEVVTRLVRAEQPVSYNGDRFQLKDAQLVPQWQADTSPAIIIGGNGEKRTLPLVARFADEWNGLMMGNEEWSRRNTLLDDLLDAEGRDRTSVRRSLMCGTIVARDQSALDADADSARFDELRARGAVIGTPNDVVEILAAKAEAGIESVQLQWLDFDDIAGLELIASTVLPQLRV